MKSTELAEYKEEQLRKDKSRLYHTSVEMYCLGYPIKSIIDKMYSRFYGLDKKVFSKTNVRDYVYLSIYDFLMKEKQQGN